MVLGLLAMGMSKQEAHERVPEIIEFSGINERGNFSTLPMNTYSSGMAARLRFAIAASRLHDVLLVDEALATGDARFRKKSEQRVREMLSGAGTVFLVSHAINTVVEVCDRTIWLESGVLRMDGPTPEVVAAYEEYVNRYWPLDPNRAGPRPRWPARNCRSRTGLVEGKPPRCRPIPRRATSSSLAPDPALQVARMLANVAGLYSRANSRSGCLAGRITKPRRPTRANRRGRRMVPAAAMASRQAAVGRDDTDVQPPAEPGRLERQLADRPLEDDLWAGRQWPAELDVGIEPADRRSDARGLQLLGRTGWSLARAAPDPRRAADATRPSRPSTDAPSSRAAYR